MVRFSDLLGGGEEPDRPDREQRSEPAPARDHLDRLAGIAAGRTTDDPPGDPDPARDGEAGSGPAPDEVHAPPRPADVPDPPAVKGDRSAFARLARESDAAHDDDRLADLPPIDDDLLPDRRRRR